MPLRKPRRPPAFVLLLLPAAMLLVAPLALAQEAPAQEAHAQEGVPWPTLPGLYVAPDGGLVSVFDLIGRVPDHQLVAIEMTSGRVRTLYPDPSDPCAFEGGAAWFVAEPPSYTLRFRCDEGGPAPALTFEEDGGMSTARRVPLRAREVAFHNGEVRLEGTLILPPGPGPHPAVVMVHGSGPVTRDGPRYLAELLAHRGVAALVYDKRGTGGSTGSWRTASYEDLAGDATAAHRLLLEAPEVDPARVGLFGASEAGYIVPLVAAREPGVALVVCRVCPGEAQRHIAPVLQRYVLETQGIAAFELDQAVAFHTALIDYAIDGTGYAELQQRYREHAEKEWMERYGFAGLPAADAPYWERMAAGHEPDPSALYARLDVPVLVVLGELDERIPVDASRAALERAKEDNPAVEVMVVPGGSHGLMEVRRGADGAALPFLRYAGDFHRRVVDWIARTLGTVEGG